MSDGDSRRGVLDLGPDETADAPRAEVARSASAGSAPRAARIDRGTPLHSALWRKRGDLGVLGVTAKKEYGGTGMG